MRAIDTNVLVYAEITTSRHHQPARALVGSLVEGAQPWAIPWPCVYEFLRIVTHPRVYHPPAPLELALTDLAAILASPSLVLLAETSRHAGIMETILHESSVTGNLVHDAHIAALCLEHGVTELLTGDRDFARFSALRVSDPFRRA
ncbi:MAG TPA: TA system VapC family ribonuclease toxin [Methylomirabilota bacterium]|nr:TA system VapC family ribonuclease toxin [Methylomirabilota bacterium]